MEILIEVLQRKKLLLCLRNDTCVPSTDLVHYYMLDILVFVGLRARTVR
jgi:hypothetical protein